MKVRHYCLTFFTEPVAKLPEGFRYAIYGKEICPETKTEHWQAYVELHNSQRMSFIKKAYSDNTIHCEQRKGTRDQAREYCKKDGQWTEYGKWISGQGHRSDLEEVAGSLIMGATSIQDVMENNPTLYCKYRNGLKDLAAAGTKKKTKEFRKLEVILITGPTGCGKTREAMKEASYRIQGTQLQWWQDYEQEDCICIDEYSNDVKITELLNILDGYQLRLNVKGSHTYANWNKVYITTNLRLEQIHKDAKPAHRNALFRRITKIDNRWEKKEDLTPPLLEDEVVEL